MGRLGGIDRPALTQGGIIHQAKVVPVLLQVALGRYDHINGGIQANQMAIDGLSHLPTRGPIRHDNQDVKVAIGSHLAACSRAKEDNPSRASDLNKRASACLLWRCYRWLRLSATRNSHDLP